MSEEFGIDSSFGNSAAVDGEIGTVFASRKSMDDFREMLFTDTGLTGDEHREIGPRDLYGNLYIPVEKRTLANNTKALFDG